MPAAAGPAEHPDNTGEWGQYNRPEISSRITPSWRPVPNPSPPSSVSVPLAEAPGSPQPPVLSRVRVSRLTFPPVLLERHRRGQVSAVGRHAGAVVGQGAALRLPGMPRGDVAAGRAAVDAVLVGRGVGAGWEEAAHRRQPRGRLRTGRETRRGRSTKRALLGLPPRGGGGRRRKGSNRKCPSPSAVCVPSSYLRVFDISLYGSLVDAVDCLARGKRRPVHAGPVFHFGGVGRPLCASQSPCEGERGRPVSVTPHFGPGPGPRSRDFG